MRLILLLRLELRKVRFWIWCVCQFRHSSLFTGVTGFEPVNTAVKVLGLTTWRYPKSSEMPENVRGGEKTPASHKVYRHFGKNRLPLYDQKIAVNADVRRWSRTTRAKRQLIYSQPRYHLRNTLTWVSSIPVCDEEHCRRFIVFVLQPSCKGRADGNLSANGAYWTRTNDHPVMSWTL